MVMKKLILIFLCIVSIGAKAQSTYGNGNTSPLFGKYPIVLTAKVTAVTIATHTLPTTNLKLMATGNLNGTKVEWVKFSADSVAAAGLGFVAISDSTGSNPQYFGGAAISATNVSTTAAGSEVWLTFSSPPLILHSGQKLYAGVTVLGSGSNIAVATQIFDY